MGTKRLGKANSVDRLSPRGVVHRCFDPAADQRRFANRSAVAKSAFSRFLELEMASSVEPDHSLRPGGLMGPYLPFDIRQSANFLRLLSSVGG